MIQALEGRLGCSTITFRHQPLSHALASIAAGGLRKVDIACIPGFCEHINPLESSEQEKRELQSQLGSLGLRVSTLNVSAGGLNTNKKEFVFRYVKSAIDLAQRLGCYAVTIPTGTKVSDAASWREHVDVTARSIRALADHAGEKGVWLTLEAPHTGTLAETVREAASYFRLLDDPRVACTFDTSHVARGNPTPVPECVAMIGAQIGHVHLRDCTGENNHLAPGKGSIDFKATLLELQKAGYTGDLILELEGEDSEQAAAELAFAADCMRKIG